MALVIRNQPCSYQLTWNRVDGTYADMETQYFSRVGGDSGTDYFDHVMVGTVAVVFRTPQLFRARRNIRTSAQFVPSLGRLPYERLDALGHTSAMGVWPAR